MKKRDLNQTDSMNDNYFKNISSPPKTFLLSSEISVNVYRNIQPNQSTTSSLGFQYGKENGSLEPQRPNSQFRDRELYPQREQDKQQQQPIRESRDAFLQYIREPYIKKEHNLFDREWAKAFDKKDSKPLKEEIPKNISNDQFKLKQFQFTYLEQTPTEKKNEKKLEPKFEDKSNEIRFELFDRKPKTESRQEKRPEINDNRQKLDSRYEVISPQKPELKSISRLESRQEVRQMYEHERIDQISQAKIGIKIMPQNPIDMQNASSPHNNQQDNFLNKYFSKTNEKSFQEKQNDYTAYEKVQIAISERQKKDFEPMKRSQNMLEDKPVKPVIVARIQQATVIATSNSLIHQQQSLQLQVKETTYVSPSIPKSYLDFKNFGQQRASSEKALQKDKQSSGKKTQSTQDLYYVSQVIKAFQAKHNPKLCEIVKEHIDQIIQGIKFSLNTNLSSPHKELIRVSLPPLRQDIKTILFDLDETLVHCNSDTTKVSDIVLNIQFPNGELLEANMNIRPYAQYTLQNLSKYFELIVFTASQSCYANKVIDYLDPQGKWISHRFYREHCITVGDGTFIKDLRTIGNRSLSNMLIVDNSSYSFAYQVDNGVPVIPYYDDKQDEELRSLQKYLMQFKNVKDVRQLNIDQLKLPIYGQYSDAVDLLKSEFKEFIDE